MLLGVLLRMPSNNTQEHVLCTRVLKDGKAFALPGGFKATMIADSVSSDNIRITTLELEYPRFIHSEFMTHRVFSRNSMSSRAIPIKKLISQVWNNPAIPIHWGANQKGMRAANELPNLKKFTCKALWKAAAKVACGIAWFMDKAGLHKQMANRVLEPFQMMKTVVTSTEWGNFFELRLHEDAQPEIRELAEVMAWAISSSVPVKLSLGDWHTPYYKEGFWKRDENVDFPDGYKDALKISASCCAQVSYRVCDDSLIKAREIFERLVESTPIHASPFEHQAIPLENKVSGMVTHITLDGCLWSGNLRGWGQHRQELKEVK